MLNINEIKIGKIIKVNNDPYMIFRTDHHKMGRGGAILKTKLKNLISGKVLDKTFQGNDKAEEAETERRKANYMYQDDANINLMDNNTFEQFTIARDQVEDKLAFLKDGSDVDVFYYEGEPVSIDIPVKVELKVTSAPPGVKGNSAGNVTKQIEVETGTTINAPLFVNEGDIIRINTDTGEYVERV